MDSANRNRLYFVTFCATLGSFSVGVYLGWTSPMMPKLRDHTPDSPLSYAINTGQEGWIGSLTAVGALFGALSIGFLANMIGRKWAILSTSVFFCTAYILLITGRQIGFIYAARIFQGIGGGIANGLVPIYLCEIATDDIRGALGSLLTLALSCGLLFVYSIGPFVSYNTLQWICLSVPFFQFFATLFCIPESPYFYAMKNRPADGVKSLRRLRGQSEKSMKSLMADIQKDVDVSMASKGSFKEIFLNKTNRKALIISCGLLTFQQLCGTKVVIINSQSIFSMAHSSLDPAIATIILGFTQLVSFFPTPYLVERIGRKIVLLISACGMSLTLFILGTFFYIQSIGDVSNFLWLPVPVMICWQIFYGFGFSSIPWSVLGEMFSPNIKSRATSIACSLNWITSFLVVRFFPELNALGPQYAFWVFSGMCGLAVLFVVFVMIETKGISLRSIQDKLQGA